MQPLALLMLLLPQATARLQDPEGLARSIEVPLDHAQPADPAQASPGRAALRYELGAPFDPARPTLLVIADAQQFYLRPGTVARLQHDEFGDAFNVVGIFGRGTGEEFLQAALDAEGRTDWARAWRLFHSFQYVEDIESVRTAVVGQAGQVLLYGVSGGALLVHEYLARHGQRVQRAFTAAAVNPFLMGRLGLCSDRFWEELGAHDPALQQELRRALERHRGERDILAMTLQRQNFFVPAERLPQARAELIRALSAGDEERYAAARTEYQVDVVRTFFDAPAGIPVRVREFEFFYPAGVQEKIGGAAFFPDLENQYNFARPLIELCDAGRIPAPAFDTDPAHALRTEVLVLAGRWDHAVDYRSSIALAALYPRGRLLLADDDHMFQKLKGDASYRRLMVAFLASGFDSAPFQEAMTGVRPHLWRE
ncbi:MAG: hypothetical protein EYC70_17060 [Planctomycetota bacterium]|nr:MAG: hypothetical protein EYC70_17060 [Planctomycetota bacterium]